jgi:hypothetical protein
MKMIQAKRIVTSIHCGEIKILFNSINVVSFELAVADISALDLSIT